MCGPSSGTKAINKTIQDFSNKVTAQAGEIFGDASQVFNTIMGSIKGIITGGPSQHGFSQNEINAKNSAAVTAGATENRNLRAAAGSAVGAIGGGNVVTPAGSMEQIVNDSSARAASDTAAAKNNIVQEDFATGRDNFFKASQLGENLPSVFNASTAADSEATSAQTTAFKSQQEMDQESNWAMNDIMKLGTSFVGGLAGGLGGGLTKGLTKGIPKAPSVFNSSDGSDVG